MIDKVVPSFDEAVADVADGSIILIGGFGPANGVPSYLIRALHKKGSKNLTIACNTPGQGRATGPAMAPPPGMPVRRAPPEHDNAGLLIQNFQVSKAIAAFPGTPRPGFPSPLHDQARAGTLTIEMVGQGTLAERIRAAKAGIPAFYTRTGAGTLLAKGKEVRAFNGKEYLLEYALKGDFSFIRAHQADRRGNLVFQGTSRNFNGAMAGASRITIAEVDELVEVGAFNPEAVATPGIYVQRVVVRPKGGQAK